MEAAPESALLRSKATAATIQSIKKEASEDMPVEILIAAILLTGAAVSSQAKSRSLRATNTLQKCVVAHMYDEAFGETDGS